MLKITISLITTSLLFSSPATAQFNASNSSGINTTSFGGTSSSIWNSNRKEAPIQKLIPPVTYERPTEIVPVAVTIERSCPPIIKGANTVVNYNTSSDCPIVTISAPTKVYPKSPAPRGRG